MFKGIINNVENIEWLHFQREHNLGLELDTSESETETCMMTRPSEPLAKRDRYKYQYCDYCEIQVCYHDRSH